LLTLCKPEVKEEQERVREKRREEKRREEKRREEKRREEKRREEKRKLRHTERHTYGIKQSRAKFLLTVIPSIYTF
jgi:hypothetical protein